MAKFQYLQTNFAGGEIGVRLLGRPDSEEFKTGVRLMKNALTAPEGGFYRRGGTRYMFKPSDYFTNVTDPRMIEFVYNGEAYFILWNPFQDNDPTTGIKCFKFRPDQEIAFAAFPFDVISTNGSYGSYIIYDNMLAPTVTPAGDVDKFVYIQLGNFIYVTHTSGLYMPIEFEVKTNAAGNVVVEHKPLIAPKNGPFGEARREPFRTPNVNKDIRFAVTDPGATSLQTITVNVQNRLGTPVNFFEKGNLWLGALFKITISSVTGIYYVDSVPSNSSAVMKYVDVVTGATGTTDNWEVSEWNQVHGFPKALTGFEQRLFLGNTKDKPNYVWGSATQNSSLFMINMLIQDLGSATDVSTLGYFGDQVPTDPVAFGLTSNEYLEIAWMNSGEELHVGTTSAEMSLRGGNDVILSREFVSSRKHSSIGGKYFQSISIGNTSLFLSREGKRAMLFRKDPETLALSTVNLNIINPDVIYNAIQVYDMPVTASGIFDIFEKVSFVKAAYQRDKQIVWFRINPTNQLVSLTIDVNARKAAWHRHTLGGTWSLDYPPLVKDIVVLPNIETNNDDVFMVVQRAEGTYIEKIGIDFYDYIRQAGNVNNDRMIFLDSAVKGTVTFVDPDYEISGLAHLNGREVRVVYANVMVDPKTYTVVGGKITVLGDNFPSVFASLATPVWVGIPYTTRVELLPTDMGGREGSAYGLLTRYHDMIIRYYNSGNFMYGDDRQLYEARIEESGEEYVYTGSATAKALLGTGVKEASIETSHERDPKIVIEMTEPKPLFIECITLKGKVNEG